jgi:hypothetical protein
VAPRAASVLRMIRFLITALLVGAALAGRPALAGEDHAHHHGALDLGGQGPVPTVAVEAKPDPMGGWNVHVRTTHFRFAPENVNRPHRPGEGHAHLYVDGKKVARLYGPWYHLGALPAGKHRLSVTLNANSHEELAVGGRKLEAGIDLAP